MLPPLHSCADPVLGKMLLMLFDRQAQSVGWQLSICALHRDQPLPTAKDRKRFIKLTATSYEFWKVKTISAAELGPSAFLSSTEKFSAYGRANFPCSLRGWLAASVPGGSSKFGSTWSVPPAVRDNLFLAGPTTLTSGTPQQHGAPLTGVPLAPRTLLAQGRAVAIGTLCRHAQPRGTGDVGATVPAATGAASPRVPERAGAGRP